MLSSSNLNYFAYIVFDNIFLITKINNIILLLIATCSILLILFLEYFLRMFVIVAFAGLFSVRRISNSFIIFFKLAAKACEIKPKSYLLWFRMNSRIWNACSHSGNNIWTFAYYYICVYKNWIYIIYIHS